MCVPSNRYVAPSIEEGEQFRQANLPRRIPDKSQPTNYRLARPGEKVSPNVIVVPKRLLSQHLQKAIEHPFPTGYD